LDDREQVEDGTHRFVSGHAVHVCAVAIAPVDGVLGREALRVEALRRPDDAVAMDKLSCGVVDKAEVGYGDARDEGVVLVWWNHASELRRERSAVGKPRLLGCAKKVEG